MLGKSLATEMLAALLRRFGYNPANVPPELRQELHRLVDAAGVELPPHGLGKMARQPPPRQPREGWGQKSKRPRGH